MLYKYLIEDNLYDKNRIIVCTKTISMTYEMIDEKVSLFSDYMRENGIKPGDRILIVNKNDITSVLAILSCIKNGYIYVVVNEKCNFKQLDYIISDCNPKMVIGAGNNIDSTNIIVSNFDWRVCYKKKIKTQRKLISYDTISYILYTSGTTSRSKGVFAKIKNVIFCIDSINKRIENSVNDRILCCLDLSFDYGLYQLFLALRFRSKIILINDYYIQEIPQLIETYKITGFPVVPSLINILVRSGILDNLIFPGLRYICSTGEHLSVTIIKSLKNLLPRVNIIPMYGLTECKRVAIMLKGNESKVLAGSCGIPIEGTTVELHDVDEKTSIGELYVYGPHIMCGYWNDPITTLEKFGYDKIKKQKYLKTGDMFRIDEDGFLYFVCRKSRIIKYNGIRFSCFEYEDIIENIEGVIEVRVFGIFDEISGEKIAACIYSTDDEVENKINSELEKWSFDFKIHVFKIFREPLPKNENGKIDEEKLKKLF